MRRKNVITPLLAFILAILMLFASCGDNTETGERTSIDFSEGEGDTETGSSQQNPTEPSETETSESGSTEPDGDDDTEPVTEVLETFFDVTEYDYEAESNEQIINYFGGKLGEELTKLAPSVKAVAYAAYCYPDGVAGAPSSDLLWCSIYCMIDTFHQYPDSANTDSNGNIIVTDSSELVSMVQSMFTYQISELGTPHEDFLDSLIFYNAEKDEYTFEPSGGEGLIIRICALEPIDEAQMNITVQLYNELFDFSSWVSLTINKNTASDYGYTVSAATVWSDE